MVRPLQRIPPSDCPRVLTISESDSRGAGGIQGDIKTILALGGHALSAITAVTVQEGENITVLAEFDSKVVASQIVSAIRDFGVDSVKIGNLQNEDIINTVADLIESGKLHDIPLVVDPAIVSRRGDVLMTPGSVSALKRRIYLHTKVLTPNLKEVELLGVMPVADIDDMRNAADMMRTLGVECVVLKGGRVAENKELYFVATSTEERIYERPTVATPHTLGAGSVLSSAVAFNLARRIDIFDAVELSLDFLHQSIVHSTGFGYDPGPVNHAFYIQKRPKAFHLEDIKIYRS